MSNFNNKEEDYLDEDKPFSNLVKKQNFCVISMLTPNAFPESKREQYKDQKILGVKVRGVFETYEQAKARAEQLQKQDKFHNIFVGEVGKWLPFNVDISTMQTEEDPVYREKSLNTYMKAYKDSLKEEEVEEKQRKEEALKGAKVVTGQTDAPAYTGIGNPEPSIPGQVPTPYNPTESSVSEQAGVSEQEQAEKVQQYANTPDVTVDEQIEQAKQDKNKIEDELKQSKTNMKDLEDKLATINQMYAELKK